MSIKRYEKRRNFIRLIFSSVSSSFFHGEVAKKAVYFTSSNVFYISDFTVAMANFTLRMRIRSAGCTRKWS